jgi:hypothetical protein
MTMVREVGLRPVSKGHGKCDVDRVLHAGYNEWVRSIETGKNAR